LFLELSKRPESRTGEEVDMPVLDARALKADPKGAAFLRDVLSQNSADRNRDSAPRLLSPFRFTKELRTSIHVASQA
jgi:hypothetical protein